MKKNVLTFGLILGLALTLNLFYTVNQCYNHPDFKGNDAIGYAAMIAVFSLIYVGIRNFRNKNSNGAITFGKAFKMGFLMVFLASSIYVLIWLFYYYLFVPDFLDKYIPHALKDVPQSELATKTKEMASFKEMYKNPLFVVLTTYLEVLPVGLIIALISSILLKRNRQIK